MERVVVEVGQVRLWGFGRPPTKMDKRIIVWRNKRYCATVEAYRAEFAMPMVHNVKDVERYWPVA